MVLNAMVCRGPTLTHPVPSPICNEFTVNDDIVAFVDILRVNVVMDDAKSDPVLKENELRKGGNVEKYREEPNPVTVDASCLSKKLVLTRFNKFGLETKLNKLGVDIKLNKLGVETKLKRLGLETTPLKDDKYPTEPNPTIDDVRFAVVGNDKPTKLETLSDEITPTLDDIDEAKICSVPTCTNHWPDLETKVTDPYACVIRYDVLPSWNVSDPCT